MLKAHPDGPLEKAYWLDLLDPSVEEIEAVERATGFTIPSKAALSEIENSSRLRHDGKTLYLSTPVLARGDSPDADLSPMGFVLSAARLVTVRFAPLRAFAAAEGEMARVEDPDGVGAFVVLLEAMVDRAADLIETSGAELDALSRSIFRNAGREGRRIARANTRLRLTLSEVGQLGERLGMIRSALLGVGRIVPFVTEVGQGWVDAPMKARLGAVRADVVSLADYETHLDGKNQFLLDAVLGFISTEQNDLFKILTIVSVVGVPPTLIASVYGMNFAYMPELHWRVGYPYALILIVCSTVLPVLWFKWKGWW